MRRRYEQEAEFFQALGHPVRLQILASLVRGSRCACEIEVEFPLDQSTISRHLVTLKRAGILRARKDGVRVIYELASEKVLAILRMARELIREQLQVEISGAEREGE